MSAATKPEWLVDLYELLETLRAEDDALVAAGELPPRSDAQATRLGLQRPQLTLIRGGAADADPPRPLLHEGGE